MRLLSCIYKPIHARTLSTKKNHAPLRFKYATRQLPFLGYALVTATIRTSDRGKGPRHVYRFILNRLRFSRMENRRRCITRSSSMGTSYPAPWISTGYKQETSSKPSDYPRYQLLVIRSMALCMRPQSTSQRRIHFVRSGRSNAAKKGSQCTRKSPDLSPHLQTIPILLKVECSAQFAIN